MTERFLTISSHLLMWGMVPLALGISLDVYLIGRVVLGSRAPAIGVAGFLLAVIALIWYVLPRSDALRRLAGRDGRTRPTRAERTESKR